MYKQIIIILIIFFLIIAFDILMQNNTKKTVNEINEMLSTLKNKMINNEKNLNSDINSIMNKWKEEYKTFGYYIEHNELEKVETELTKLRANIEVEDYNTGIENLDSCIFILNHITDKNSFKIINIF